MYKKIKSIDTIDEILEFINEVSIEVVQNWAQISVILIQLAKHNRIDEWMECRKKLKEIYIEYPELSKIRIFRAKEILRELKIRQIIE
jgi:hypothetical protein